MDQPDGARGHARRAARLGVAAVVVVLAALAGWLSGPRAPAPDTLARQVGLHGDAIRRVPEAPPPPPPAPAATPVEIGQPRTISGQVVGTLRIPKLGVEVPMLEGIDLWVIDQGSGHWPGTPMPGGKGNMVVAGHRTLYQRPFHNLDQLVAGDRVLFTDSAGTTFTYEVRGVVIVPADAVSIVNQNEAHTATLFGCHPKGAATHRIVAKLRLLDDAGRPVDPDRLLPPVDLGTGADAHVMQVSPGVAPPPG